ncbi:MAG: LysM peptidoglycan-binding domain-containing protein [Balneolaceae bacterium]|nr:LysM peptidoglycan-binding domain-containing protein [Balneolaceae bacterium]
MYLKSAVSLSALLLILAGPFQAVSGQDQEGARTHTVKAGETLYRIALQYEVSVAQLREWNNLSGNEIAVGQTLIVGKDEPEKQDAVVHEVQPQETLFSISKQYGVSIAAIKSWNNLENNALAVGQKLTVYPQEEQPGATAGPGQGEPLVVNTTTPVTTNTYYTVKSGDTLYRIAEEHDMSVDELKALNDLTSNVIRIGQRLTVRKTRPSAPSVSENSAESSPQGKFVIHTLDEQRELSYILDQFEMTHEEFYALNPDIDSASTLSAGRQITVLTPPTSSYKNPYTVEASLKDLGETLVVPYDSTEIGQTTTSGELYNPGQLTGAHSNISLGNVIFVRNPRSGKGIYLRINDRFSGNGLKISHAAARALEISFVDSATVNIFQNQ